MEERLIQTADRGTIYEFYESDMMTQKNRVLVVSNQNRCEDNLVSVLMLGTKYTGYDCVPIEMDGQTYYVHCGMVTYTKRNRLGERVMVVDEKTMYRVDMNLANNLGLRVDSNGR